MRNITLTVAMLLAVTNAYTQTTNGNINFQLSLPQGGYKATYPKTGTGFLFSIVHQLKSRPLIGLGGELGLLQISNDDNRYTGNFHGSYETYYVSATNYIFTFAPKLRVNLITLKNSGNVYMDISAGTNLFFTYGSISHDYGYDILTNEPRFKNDSSFSHSSFALRAGIGLGTAIPISKNKNLSWIFKCSYLYGSRVAYFTHPSITDVQVSLVPKESNTSMLLAETGLCFKLSHKKSKAS